MKRQRGSWRASERGMSEYLRRESLPETVGNSSKKKTRNLSDPPSLSFSRSSLFLSLSKKKNSTLLHNRQGSNPLKMGVPKRVPSLNSQVEARCREMGGDRAIHSVLVANNGLAAVKFIRSVRSWAYKTFGNERAVAIVAMATPEDMRIDAEHIRMADQFVEVSSSVLEKFSSF